MTKKDEMLARIDERVRTIFNEIKAIKKAQEEANKKHYHCQIDIIPKMMGEIKELKQRPLGLTAFLASILKQTLR